MYKSNNKLDLKHKVIQLAQNVREKIIANHLSLSDLQNIAHLYHVTLSWKEMGADVDGCYFKDLKSIVLNQNINYRPRKNFSFFHELMHHIIDINDEIYELIYNSTVYPNLDYMDEWIEEFCNIGSAEILIPSHEVNRLIKSNGFSPALIPILSERFDASSIATAFQMLNIASHKCYLVIAEPHKPVKQNKKQNGLLFEIATVNQSVESLIIIYSGGSASTQYSISKLHDINQGHILYDALKTNNVISGEDRIPFRSKRDWNVPCQAIQFQNKIFAFFNVTSPISQYQMTLFD